MGRIGKHLKAEIDKYIEQTIETRLNYKQTAYTFTPSGEDSPPLKDDRIILVSIDGKGKFAAVGVLTVSQGAKPGEKILYSRNNDGEVQAVLSLLNDGKVKLETPEEVSLETDKGMNVIAKEDINIESEKRTTVKGADVELNGKVVATGGTFECKGKAEPDGSGCLCGLQYCVFNGAPQSGKTASET